MSTHDPPLQSRLLHAAEDPAVPYIEAFVAAIARGELDLPAWSRMTERARMAVADDDTDDETLARLLGAEAGLAVRVLNIANAAMFARGDAPIVDLRQAVRRLGRDCIRSAVYAHALAQLRHAPALGQLREELRRLWRESTAVAILAYRIAREQGAVDPDAALLAGLLHNIGKLALLVRLPQAPATLQAPPARERLLALRHARIGCALVRYWQFSAEICAAIGGQGDLDLLHEGRPGLGDVLAAAVIASREPQEGQLAATTLAECHRFGMDAGQWFGLIEGARLEAAAVRVAFGE